MPQVDLAEIPDVLGLAFMADDRDHESRVRESQNLALIGGLLRTVASGDFRAIGDSLTPDMTFELIGPAGCPWVRRAEGREEVTRALESNFRSVRNQRPEILSLVAQGDTIMLMAREAGTWTATGTDYESVAAQQYTFRDGVLASFRSVVVMTD